MAQKSSRSGVDIAFIVLFGLLAGVGCLCSSFAVIMAIAEPGQGDLEVAPVFFGLTLAGIGSMAMVALRRRYQMGWPLLLVALILWSMGSAVFAFGLTATLMYDEPAQFMSNLGYSMGLCIAPGAFLALIGLFVFGFEAWREPRQTNGAAAEPVSSAEGAADWLRSVKAQEKSKLDEDVF